MSDYKDHAIATACERYGAKAVSDAATRRMNGDRQALPRLGIEDPQTLADADHIMTLCYRLMTPEERALDLAEATIDGARLSAG